MKIGDLVKVKAIHFNNGGEVGIIIEDPFPEGHNHGKAWRVLFAKGLKPKLSHQLELISESR